MKISITRALAELKLLDERIQKEIRNGIFIDMRQKKFDKTTYTKKSIDEFEKDSKADYQSVNDLIARRNKIKSLVLNSNSNTKVKIGNLEMTVVEAIDMKTAIRYKETLLARLRGIRDQIHREIESNNIRMETALQQMLQQSYGSNQKVTEEQANGIRKPYVEANQIHIVDSIGIENEIKKLDSEIDSFKSEVDFVLSESNSRTEIEV